jgi:hypothetical protein
MTKLLNRIAWAVSITLGFLLLFLFFISFHLLSISNSFLFSWIIWTLILWVIIKGTFFSKDFIEERLNFFVESIKKKYLVNEYYEKENKHIEEENIPHYQANNK